MRLVGGKAVARLCRLNATDRVRRQECGAAGRLLLRAAVIQRKNTVLSKTGGEVHRRIDRAVGAKFNISLK